MGILPGVVVLTSVVNCIYGYAVAPKISWPPEYHFNGEEVNLVAGVLKPFELWYSSTYNRARFDLYDGTVRRYYYGTSYNKKNKTQEFGHVFMVHPRVTPDDSKTEVKCELSFPNKNDAQTVFLRDLLPDLADFTYSGEKQHEGKRVQVWTREQKGKVYRKQETMLVTVIDADAGIAIPLHHYTRNFVTAVGSIRDDIVVHYYNYNHNVQLNDLDVSNAGCKTWTQLSDDLQEALTVLHPTINSDVDSAFHRFKRHHGRVYRDDNEHKMRREIFRDNWRFIEEHNSKNLSYRLGVNEFADRTKSELAYLTGMKVSDPIREGTHKFPHSDAEIEAMAKDEEIPETFDLRCTGLLSPVKKQVHCGSCVAFAVTATVEGALARANGSRVVDLSEQSLIDCAWAFQSQGCQGAQIDGMYRYIMNYGVPTVADYGPYLDEDGVCNIRNMSRVHFIKSYVPMITDNPHALRAAVYKHGPLAVDVQFPNRLNYYQSGVFYATKKDCTTADFYYHAMTLVGYGVRDGDPYWVLKNSWGESWGQNGYLLLSAKDKADHCNILQYAYYPVL